jgi:hypothetical protein
MTSVAEISWDAVSTPDCSPPTHPAFREALTTVADRARAILPASQRHIDAAVAIVLAADVEVLTDGLARVASQDNGTTGYHIVNGHCDCAAFPISFLWPENMPMTASLAPCPWRNAQKGSGFSRTLRRVPLIVSWCIDLRGWAAASEPSQMPMSVLQRWGSRFVLRQNRLIPIRRLAHFSFNCSGVLPNLTAPRCWSNSAVVETGLPGLGNGQMAPSPMGIPWMTSAL